MKTIKEVYSGFIRLTSNTRKGTFNIGTYDQVVENTSITDHLGCKLSVSKILEERPARGNFSDTPPTVYVIKAKITYRPELKVE
jgi:hypothetical protein